MPTSLPLSCACAPRPAPPRGPARRFRDDATYPKGGGVSWERRSSAPRGRAASAPELLTELEQTGEVVDVGLEEGNRAHDVGTDSELLLLLGLPRREEGAHAGHAMNGGGGGEDHSAHMNVGEAEARRLLTKTIVGAVLALPVLVIANTRPWALR